MTHLTKRQRDALNKVRDLKKTSNADQWLYAGLLDVATDDLLASFDETPDPAGEVEKCSCKPTTFCSKCIGGAQ